MLTPGADPVRKVSIIPRGMALGVTFSAPDADRFNYLKPDILGKIKVALGGRAAEEIVYGEISTGAESDIEQLTALARQMVGRWGMSEALGPISVIPRDGSAAFPGASDVSPDTQRLVDEEVRRIVAEAHEEVVTLLTENRARLDSLVEALLEHETLDEDDAYAAAGVARAPRATLGELATAARSMT
jgi:cell division protease FtsH